MHRYTLRMKVATNELTDRSRGGLLVVAADKLFFFQWCFTITSTETVWLIRDWGRMGQGVRAQAHLPVHTAPEL